MTAPTPDPRLDLVIERVIDAPKELVWRAWTTPAHIKQWWAPAPWTTADCEIDLRPGGQFYTVLCTPDGEHHPNRGCYLEVVEGERLVWTIALGPGYRPAPGHPVAPAFTAVITFEAHGQGTKYTATVMHQDEAGAKRHAEMGFFEGWGTVTDQMIALVTGELAANR